MFDSERFNGFVNNELGRLIIEDIRNYYVFNESDLHSAAYYYIRKFFSQKDSDHSDRMVVRCEPSMGRKRKTKPDIVVFNKYNPNYFIELKMFRRKRYVIDLINKKDIQRDLKKLNSYLKKYTAKWGFLIVIYDSDEICSIKAKEYGYDSIKVVTINMRLNEKGRLRRDYEKWRGQFDKYLEMHS